VVVSSASGAVGSIVMQLARLKGCKEVVGIVGSESKRQILIQKGFKAVNYRLGNLAQDLKQALPEGVDVYFDNVGGEMLDIVLGQIRSDCRVVLCGAISSYDNEKNTYRLKNYPRLIIKKGRMQGFIYFK
jgi:NADPH-dependent curcumin reductase CurA